MRAGGRTPGGVRAQVVERLPQNTQNFFELRHYSESLLRPSCYTNYMPNNAITDAMAIEAWPPAAARPLAYQVARGKSVLDACMDLDIDPTVAVDWVNDLRWAELVREYVPGEVEVRDKFSAMAAGAQKLLDDILTGDEPADPRTRVNVAQDILDRAGYTPVKRITTITYKPTEAKQTVINNSASEAVLDVEIVEES